MNLIELIKKSKEFSLAKGVLRRIDANECNIDTLKAFLKYEKKINKKGYRPDNNLRYYIEEEYKSYLKKIRQFIHNDSYERHMKILKRE